ncbi:MAG: RNA polymerase factor sigma-54, partial [Alistipes sp.]|nr:RNA polymerase factor sigma-54 [Alistipes sp.]
MTSRLQQTIQLQQKISPQQIQMIKLLELPTMQLEERIKREIEENIVLEEDAENKSEEDTPEKISVDDYIGKEDDTPAYKARINNYSKDDKQRPVYITEGHSLSESLVEQLRFRSLTDEELLVAVYIVGSIDDDGYLRRDLESLSDDLAFTRGLDVSVAEIERILHIVHELEPAGIGARTLQECLTLQLNRLTLDTRPKRLALKIITNYFEAFTKKHYERLMERLRTTEEEFREAIDFIRTLSPKPGNLYTEGGIDTTPYITPDFLLDNSDGEMRLSLNTKGVPEVRISRRYRDMMKDMVAADGTVKAEDREAVQFVKSKIDSAKWFISAIKQRHDTLMRTMQTILDFQREYFQDGDKSKLKPMILKDIADRTDLDVSTISRVVNSK